MAKSWTGTVAALLAGGAVGVFLAPVATPAVARMMRPTTKAALKAGKAVYERGLQAAAEVREMVEDVSAEIAAEADAAAQPASDKASPGAVDAGPEFAEAQAGPRTAFH